MTVESDQSLLKAWHAGDRKAGEMLFARHFKAVHRFFRTKVDGRADQEDLAQATFAALAERPEQYAGRSSLRSYILGIAHHKLLQHYRSKRRHRERVDQ